VLDFNTMHSLTHASIPITLTPTVYPRIKPMVRKVPNPVRRVETELNEIGPGTFILPSIF